MNGLCVIIWQVYALSEMIYTTIVYVVHTLISGDVLVLHLSRRSSWYPQILGLGRLPLIELSIIVRGRNIE